ncbi:MAG TPA: hypothetical protein VM686_30325, partial [Polyangiaceae bacterium]|nr:hypothetical protein [Polyangiaceae bacterium]
MSSAADTKLPEKFEKLLADMPVADRDWDALAAKVVERAMSASDTPANLLEPPLPPEEGEAGFERSEAKATSAPKATVSLAELARASVKKKNEGTKDIALESLAVATQARAQVDEIAERVQAATRQPRASTPDVEEAKPVAKPPVAKAEKPAPREAATEPPAAPAQQVVAQPARVSRGPWIVSGFAVLAAAAAIAISVSKKEAPPPLVMNEVSQ